MSKLIYITKLPFVLAIEYNGEIYTAVNVVELTETIKEITIKFRKGD